MALHGKRIKLDPIPLDKPLQFIALPPGTPHVRWSTQQNEWIEDPSGEVVKIATDSDHKDVFAHLQLDNSKNQASHLVHNYVDTECASKDSSGQPTDKHYYPILQVTLTDGSTRVVMATLMAALGTTSGGRTMIFKRSFAPGELDQLEECGEILWRRVSMRTINGEFRAHTAMLISHNMAKRAIRRRSERGHAKTATRVYNLLYEDSAWITTADYYKHKRKEPIDGFTTELDTSTGEDELPLPLDM